MRLERVQRRQQEVAPFDRLVPAARDAPVGLDHPLTAGPSRGRRAQHGIHGSPLVVGRNGIGQDEIHEERQAPTGSGSLSIRTALALNSAVPDFGSVASIVSTFVST